MDVLKSILERFIWTLKISYSMCLLFVLHLLSFNVKDHTEFAFKELRVVRNSYGLIEHIRIQVKDRRHFCIKTQ